MNELVYLKNDEAVCDSYAGGREIWKRGMTSCIAEH